MKSIERSLMLALSAGAFVACNVAHAENGTAQESALSVTGSASFVSEYLLRGVSQTQGRPTAQASMELAHASGFYAGIWGSGVSNAAYNNSNGTEIDLYFGYRSELGGGYAADVGIIGYVFPGAYYAAGNQRIEYDTQELKLGISKGSLSLNGYYALSKRWAGLTLHPYSGNEVSTRGSTYLEANWNPEVAPGWTLNLHAGRQMVRNLEDYNFADVKAGVTRTLGTWQLSLAVSHNNANAVKNGVPLWTFFDADGTGRDVVGTRWVASVNKSF